MILGRNYNHLTGKLHCCCGSLPKSLTLWYCRKLVETNCVPNTHVHRNSSTKPSIPLDRPVGADWCNGLIWLLCIVPRQRTLEAKAMLRKWISTRDRRRCLNYTSNTLYKTLALSTILSMPLTQVCSSKSNTGIAFLSYAGDFQSCSLTDEPCIKMATKLSC